MKISYVSDIHLDWQVPFCMSQIKWKKRTVAFIQQLIESDQSEKDVLIIAGDISHFNNQSYWAIVEFAKAYKQVYLCFGNHDYYLISKNQENKYKGHSLNRIIELHFMINELTNVRPLIGFEKHFITNDISIAGDTFWYPIESLEQISFFYNISNDSKLIKKLNIGFEHNMSNTNYANLDAATIIVTHIPPIVIDSHKFYNSTTCYLNPVHEMKTEHWIMGHCHEQTIYKREYGNFYMNAIGYDGEWQSHFRRSEDDDILKFREKWFTIKTFEV